jgi:hypothetical protein
MVNRIIVNDTDNQRSKVFALTKPLDVHVSQGFVLSRKGDQIQNHEGHTYITDELGHVLNAILSLQAVREVVVLNDSEVQVTIGPAFYWSDQSDGVSFYQHIIQAFYDNWEGGTDIEVVANGAPSYIEVHAGGSYSKLFICDLPITQAAGDHTLKKNNGSGSIGSNSNDPDANKIARALLLNPNIMSVTINGKQVVVVGGYWASNGYSYDSQITDAVLGYITGVLRANLYPNEQVSVRQES